jgi:cholinesterase
MLVGNNDNEVGLFKVLDDLGAASNSLSKTPGTSSNPFSIITDTFQNTAFTCAAEISAQARRAAGVPAWRYRYAGVWPNMEVGPKAGAWHASEVSMVFGTTERVSKSSDTAQQKVLGETMRAAWTSFAKDPEHGLEKFHWPLYDTSSKSAQSTSYDLCLLLNAVS